MQKTQLSILTCVTLTTVLMGCFGMPSYRGLITPVYVMPHSAEYVAVTQDVSLIAVVSHDGKLSIIDTKAKKIGSSLQGAHGKPAFSADGSILAYKSRSGATFTVRLIEPRTRSVVADLPESMDFDLIAFSSDGQRLLASRPTGVSLWDLQTRTLVRTINGRLLHPWTFSGDGKYLAMSFPDSAGRPGDILVLNSRDGLPATPDQLTLPNDEEVVSATFSPDNRHLLLLGEHGLLRLYEIPSAREMSTLTPDGSAPIAATFMNGGKSIFATLADGRYSVWSVDMLDHRTGFMETSTKQEERGWAFGVMDFSPHGAIFFSTYGDSSVHCSFDAWRTRNGAYIDEVGNDPGPPLEFHDCSITDYAIAASGKEIVVGHGSRDITRYRIRE